MKIKTFLVIIYSLAGFLISALSAFLTFLIIDEPIGNAMILKIMMVILFMLPITLLISFFLGNFLSARFKTIQSRLQQIESSVFVQDNNKNTIEELNDINQSINVVSFHMDTYIQDLKKKNKNLTNLLISMAHDLKTPITILNGHIDEFQDRLISNSQKSKVLIKMKDEIMFLDELTVDMLEYINSMRNHKRKERIDFHAFVQDEVFPLLPEQDSIKYLNNIEKRFFILFNKVDLKKICINLFLNAIRYTKSGHIEIKNNDQKIIFENTGETISENVRDKMFEPFFTTLNHGTKDRKSSGFGLGLSIVKNLSNNNNYDCFLFRSDQERTTFYLIALDVSQNSNPFDLQPTTESPTKITPITPEF